MTTIVMNTATGAVSEYDWQFQSITERYAASDDGLFELGGDTDDGEPIDAEFLGGKPGGEKVLSIGNVYIAVTGGGAGALVVAGKSDTWTYPIEVRGSGICRAKPGRGIRETRLALGYRNTDGADFRIDRIDAEIEASKNRRN